jgi:Na+/H+-dicarboxylate symporter
MLKAYLSVPLWQRVLAGLVLGGLFGVLAPATAQLVGKPIGDAYGALIRMIVTPLLFVSIVVSVGALRHSAGAARLGLRTLGWYVITAALAAIVGIGFALVLEPGHSVTGLALADVKPKQIPGFVEVLVGLIPANPVKAFADGNVLQILVLALIVGGVLAGMGEKGDRLRGVFEDANSLVMRVVRIVLQVTPFGTFGLIAAVVGKFGLDVLAPLGDFIIAMYLACAFHIIVVYGGLIKIHGLPLRSYFRGIWPVFQHGFVTSSSYATLPETQRTLTDRLGVPTDYAAFAAPLGATMKMDACGAIYPAIAAIFFAQYTGVQLDVAGYLAIFLAATLGTLATAGVPGPAVVSLTLTLNAVGLPLEYIGYIIAVDRVVDMMRTGTNVVGQATVPVLVAAEEQILDRQAFAETRPVPQVVAVVAAE